MLTSVLVLLMEYAPYGNLETLVINSRGLSELSFHTVNALSLMFMSLIEETRAKEVTRQICSALDYLHGAPRGIVHRDVKPAVGVILRCYSETKITSMLIFMFGTECSSKFSRSYLREAVRLWPR